jgi:hypothetical protein
LPLAVTGSLQGWQIAAIVQVQSGNPINIITSDSTVNGVANTLRPDVTGPVAIIGSVDRWFDTAAFTPVARSGNLGPQYSHRGPGFSNTDFSISKNTKISEAISVQFRAEFFDVFQPRELRPARQRRSAARSLAESPTHGSNGRVRVIAPVQLL